MDTNTLPETVRVKSVNFERPLIISVVSAGVFTFFHVLAFKWVALGTFIIAVARFIRSRTKTSTAIPVTAAQQDFKHSNRYLALKRALSKAQFETLTETVAGKALDQLSQSEERMTSFERTLSLKLSPTELTYARYHDAAQAVSLAVLDQLNEITTRIATINSIKNTNESANSEDLKRNEIREKELQKITDALTQNETALTRMDELTQAISEMKSLSATNQNLAPLLTELEALAERAKKY